MKPSSIVEQMQDICGCLERKNIIFYYVGYFSQSIITAMSDAVKLRIKYLGTEGKTQRKLFSSFIEMAQNIVHYSADSVDANHPPDINMGHGALLMLMKEDKYYLYCTNLVNNDLAQYLQDKLQHLQTLDNEEIKQEYKEMLRGETPADSKGAGLGLLTVARDASQPLEFEFTPAEAKGISNFFLKVTI